jgi:asparagine synthetase B (glutamine-hydrolysing)
MRHSRSSALLAPDLSTVPDLTELDAPLNSTAPRDSVSQHLRADVPIGVLRQRDSMAVLYLLCAVAAKQANTKLLKAGAADGEIAGAETARQLANHHRATAPIFRGYRSRR